MLDRKETSGINYVRLMCSFADVWPLVFIARTISLMKAENLFSFCRMLENSWRGEDLHPELGHEDGVLCLGGPRQDSI